MPSKKDATTTRKPQATGKNQPKPAVKQPSPKAVKPPVDDVALVKAKALAKGKGNSAPAKPVPTKTVPVKTAPAKTAAPAAKQGKPADAKSAKSKPAATVDEDSSKAKSVPTKLRKKAEKPVNLEIDEDLVVSDDVESLLIAKGAHKGTGAARGVINEKIGGLIRLAK